jgi:AAA+ ATPase superfamily predicted ATPase
MQQAVIGRQKEQKLLVNALKSPEAEFIAVYGRRRVGKTHLIRAVVESLDLFSFECTGLKDGALSDQLAVFTRAFTKAFNLGFEIKTPESWMEAFGMLTKIIDDKYADTVVTLFFDELPWLATTKSNLLQALDHFWNTEWTRRNTLKLIVCGSAASWILDNLINAKGGLHNRLTKVVQLRPFTINETSDFLKSRNVVLTHKQLLDLYLVMGGIPYYLKAVDKSISAVQNINELCFTKEGLLFNEFNRLLISLFNNSEAHNEIIRAIARKSNGIDQDSLLTGLKLSASGGTFTKRLNELEKAGFIISFIPYGRDKKGIYYRVIDEYVLFYIQWIEPVANRIKLSGSQSHYWQSKFKSPSWLSWSGYAFEAFCYKHIDFIVKALNVHVGYEIGTWRYVPAAKQVKGTQIDLLLDRDDGVINIIEIKYSDLPFRITKQYAESLGEKIDIFKEQTRTKKVIHLTIITVNDILENQYSDVMVNQSLTLEDIIKG